MNTRLHDSEYRFAAIVWEFEPVGSGELVKLCSERLGWKKSTTYTILKKLCDRGILKNQDAVVTSLISKDEILQHESQAVMDQTFSGSLPAFINAFLKNRSLTQDEAEEIVDMIQKHCES